MGQAPQTSPEYSHDTPAQRITPAIKWLIAINLAVYFIQLTVVKPADVQLALGFQKENLGHQWWTIGTYMFVHEGFWHLALNMYALWLFGPRLEQRWGSSEFVRYYLFCGVGGWFAHLAFVGGDSTLTGASGAVLGVLLAYVSFWPDERVFAFATIPTTVRWLVTLMGVTIIGSGMASARGPGGIDYLAHLGGLVAGLLYLRATAAVNLGRLRRGVLAVPDEPDDAPPRAVPRTLPRSRTRDRESIDEVVARSNATVAERSPSRHAAPEPQADLAALDKALDKVLDKISAHGLASLSRDERRLLDEASRRLRDP
jgi:membrane associated rhomboid family serine protease